MTGTIKCQCGKVVIKVQNPNPRYRLQCGCCDCRQAVQWANLQGGPKVPNQPLDIWYFENDIKITSGKDELKWIKLRSDGKVIFKMTWYTHKTNLFLTRIAMTYIIIDIVLEMLYQVLLHHSDDTSSGIQK